MKVEGEIVQTLHSIFMLDWEYVSDEVLIDQKAYSCPVLQKAAASIKSFRRAPI